MVHSRTTRRLFFAEVALALAFAACSGRSPAHPEAAAAAVAPPAADVAGTTGSAQNTEAAASSATVDRDPEAIKALEGMGTYLRTLKTFQVRSETSRDEVLDDGQIVQFDGVADMLVERPNRLRAEVTSDKQQRFYFDDGKAFSVWARRVNYYATVPAPPTLRELADTLADKYDLELPLVDLFYWGDRKSANDITGAIDLGASQVDGITCEHYAYRQAGVDWQIWIQQGAFPLPRRLVIATTTDASRPRFTSVMTWNLAPSYDDTAFTFVPPKDAKLIAMAPRPTSQPEQ